MVLVVGSGTGMEPGRTNIDKKFTRANRAKKDKMRVMKEDKNHRIAAVLFTENTKNGELAERLRGALEKIEDILGYRIKGVERSGTPLKQMFPLTKVGGGQECGREDCRTCTQDSRGEKLPPCTKRSVLYENICVKCNPDVVEDKKGSKGWSPTLDKPSIYVGETAKSLYERGKEHWYSYRTKAEDSHILKHHLLHHGGEGEPHFHLRPVKYFRTALTRQIHEAVRIGRWGEDVVMNSKGECNLCKISRLTLGEEFKDKRLHGEDEGDHTAEDRMVRGWEKERTSLRRAQEVQAGINLERGLIMSPSRKRTIEDDNPNCNNRARFTNPTNPTTTTTKRRKLKYPIMEEDWGLEDDILIKENDRNISKEREGDQSEESLVSGRIPKEKVIKGWSPQEIPRGGSPTRPKGDLQKVELPGNQEVPESVTPRVNSNTDVEKTNGKAEGNTAEISRHY